MLERLDFAIIVRLVLNKDFGLGGEEQEEEE